MYCIPVSWLPANAKFGSQFWLGQGHCQPQFENKQPITCWVNGTVSHQSIVNSQSVDELNIYPAIQNNIQIHDNLIWEWMTQTVTRLEWENNMRLNWISRQPPWDLFWPTRKWIMDKNQFFSVKLHHLPSVFYIRVGDTAPKNVFRCFYLESKTEPSVAKAQDYTAQ